jgi:hypothetical protein
MTDHEKNPGRIEQEVHFIKEEVAHLKDAEHVIQDELRDLGEEVDHLEEEARREHGEDHPHDGREDGGGDHDDHRPATVEITMVVNGQPVVIQATEQEPLRDVRHKALEETKNLAQPPENWEIKNEAGVVLDPEKKVGEFEFGKKVTLFLSLKAGVAGV